jgi:DNA-binding XRE family transcriptional regulator
VKGDRTWRLSAFVAADLGERIYALARERGCSVTGIVEEALLEYLTARPAGTRLPLVARLPRSPGRPSKFDHLESAAREERMRKRTGRTDEGVALRRQRVSAPLGELARVLRAIRAEQGVDQLRLAHAMGAGDATYLGRLENGRSTNPSAACLRRYVFAYTLLGRPLTKEQVAQLASAVFTSRAA